MAEEKSKAARYKLGEILLQHKIISSNMLKNALRRQSQVGGQIGSILIEMGYITTDLLLDFLSKQFGVPPINLFKIDIPPQILNALPIKKIKEYKVLPLKVEGHFVLAMVNPRDFVAIEDIEFILGKRVRPVVVTSSQMEAALKSLESVGTHELKGTELEKACLSISDEASVSIEKLLDMFSESTATDLQLTAGVPPSLRMDTELKRLNMPAMTPAQLMTYATNLMSEDQLKKFETTSDLDFAFSYSEKGRFRVNIYKQRNSVSITLRRIPAIIPGLKELGVPEELESFALKPQGLILITGPAGHGKSTTMASLVDIINTRRKCNIIALEDPIEFLHRHKNSNVNQREIGADTPSFYEGLRHVFRQDPDVIVIGEMRDPDSFRIALQAAETGHLVLSTLHSRNVTSTIERTIDIFPPHQQAQIRTQMADCLLVIFSQRLIAHKNRTGLVLAYEKLINSYKIKNFIREGKTHQIRSQMQIPGEEYSSIDVSLATLCIEGRISFEEGARHADNVSYYQDMVKTRGIR